MAQRKRSIAFFLFLAVAGLILLVQFVGMDRFFGSIDRLFGPAKCPSLDPKAILGETTPTLPVATGPLREKENLDFLASLPSSDADATEVLRASLEPLASFGHPAVQERRRREVLQDLLRLKEREGRDNAMIHYVAAAWFAPSRTTQRQRELIDDVLRNGWLSPLSEELVPYLESWRPAQARIREGAALDYARGTGRIFPSPEGALDLALYGRILCLEGRYLESRNRAREALDCYLAALTMGRDFTAPGAPFSSQCAGYEALRLPLGQICQLADGLDLDDADIRRAMSRLRRIEQTLGTTAEAFEIEMAYRIEELKQLIETPGALEKRIEKEIERQLGRPMTRQFWDAVASLPYKNLREDFFREMKLRTQARRTERIPSDLTALCALARRHVATPWAEGGEDADWRRHHEFREACRASHPLFLSWSYFPPFLETRRSEMIARSFVCQTRVVLALALWKREHREYPDALARLGPEYFPEGVPTVPSSGESYDYLLKGAKIDPVSAESHYIPSGSLSLGWWAR